MLSVWSSIQLYLQISFAYPGIPPDSILLASVTSFDQASNCHFFCPRTPANTAPVWMPTRMSKLLTPVWCRTLLKYEGNIKPLKLILPMLAMQLKAFKHTHLKMTRTCGKSILQASRDLSTSCNELVSFFKLQAACQNQACCNLSFADLLYNSLKQLATSLWVTSFGNQLATSLFTNCNRLIVNKLSQAMRTHPDLGLLTMSLLNKSSSLPIYDSVEDITLPYEDTKYIFEFLKWVITTCMLIKSLAHIIYADNITQCYHASNDTTSHSRNMIDHSQTHVNRWGSMSVVSLFSVGRIQARDTIVTVTKNFDSLTVVFLWKYVGFQIHTCFLSSSKLFFLEIQ